MGTVYLSLVQDKYAVPSHSQAALPLISACIDVAQIQIEGGTLELNDRLRADMGPSVTKLLAEILGREHSGCARVRQALRQRPDFVNQDGTCRAQFIDLIPQAGQPDDRQQ